jgi:hypothetical protein
MQAVNSRFVATQQQCLDAIYAALCNNNFVAVQQHFDAFKINVALQGQIQFAYEYYDNAMFMHYIQTMQNAIDAKDVDAILETQAILYELVDVATC